MEELNSGGREAIQSWIAAFGDMDPTEGPVSVSRLNGAFTLATLVYNEQGGAVISEVLAEAQRLFRKTRNAGLDRFERARLAANLGKSYEQLAGDRRSAQRWYFAALLRNRNDEVAIDGIARLRRTRGVIERKEAEGDRARELEAFFQSFGGAIPPESGAGNTAAQH